MTDYRPTPPALPTQTWSEPTYDDQLGQHDQFGQHNQDDQPGVKDRAGESFEQGKQAAGDLASTVTDKAGDVKDETAKQARDLVNEARTQLNQHAGEQHQNLVTNLRSLSSELHEMTSSSNTSGVATSLASQARGHVDTVADWLDQREPDQLVGDLRGFARKRPGVFLLGAVAAGVVAGRLTRGAIDAHSDDSPSSTPNGSTNGYAATPTIPPIAASQPGTADLGLQTDPAQPFVPSTDPGYASDPGYGTRAPAGQPFDPPPYDTPAHPVPGFGQPSYASESYGQTSDPYAQPGYPQAAPSAPTPYGEDDTTRYDRESYAAPVDETRDFRNDEWRGEGSPR